MVVIFYILALFPSILQILVPLLGNYFIGFLMRVSFEVGIPLGYYTFVIKQSIFNQFRSVPVLHVILWSLATVVVVSLTLLSVTPFLDVTQISLQLQQIYTLTPFVYFLVALTISLLNPIVEEIFWRGFLFAQSRSMWIGAVFGLHHTFMLYSWIGPVLSIVVGVLLGLVGVLFNYLYAKHNSIVLPLVMHMVADIVIMVYGYWLLF